MPQGRTTYSKERLPRRERLLWDYLEELGFSPDLLSMPNHQEEFEDEDEELIRVDRPSQSTLIDMVQTGSMRGDLVMTTDGVGLLT